MNRNARSLKNPTGPRRAAGKRSARQANNLFDPGQSLVRLVREIRTHHEEIEKQNKELRNAIVEMVHQRRVEEKLQKSQAELETRIEDRTLELQGAYELLNTIFASIDIHIAYLDPDFNFISVNQVYAAAQGREPDFYSGKNYFDLFPNDENEAIFRDVIETGEPYYEYEKAFFSEGNSGQGVTYWDWSIQPVQAPGGAINGLVLSMINVTDRKRAEEDTIRLAAAIESAGDGVIITDVRGMIKYVNPAFEKMTGYSKQEAIGRDKDIIDSGKQGETFYQNVRESIRRRGSWTGRVINKKKDGCLYTEECTWSVIRNQSGQIINYVSIGRDITEKLRLEESVAGAANGVANTHSVQELRQDLGNHINSVIGNLDRLKADVEHMGKTDIKVSVEGCLHEALRISRLLKH